MERPAPSDKAAANLAEILSLPYEKGRRLLKKVVLEGTFPASMRGRLWLYLLQPEPRLLQQWGPSLTDTPCPEQENYFTRDIPRTFPLRTIEAQVYGNPDLQEGLFRFSTQALFRVLRASCNLRTDLGYCSGQSFLGAFLLMQMGEPEAFACFVTLVTSPRYWQAVSFGASMAALRQQLARCWDDFLRRQRPAVAEWLAAAEVDVWTQLAWADMATIFLFHSQSLMTSARIWDYYLLHGRPAVFALQLALHDMRYQAEKGRPLDIETVIAGYRDLLCFVDPQTLLRTAEGFRKAAQAALAELDVKPAKR